MGIFSVLDERSKDELIDLAVEADRLGVNRLRKAAGANADLNAADMRRYRREFGYETFNELTNYEGKRLVTIPAAYLDLTDPRMIDAQYQLDAMEAAPAKKPRGKGAGLAGLQGGFRQGPPQWLLEPVRPPRPAAARVQQRNRPAAPLPAAPHIVVWEEVHPVEPMPPPPPAAPPQNQAERAEAVRHALNGLNAERAIVDEMMAEWNRQIERAQAANYEDPF